MLASEFASIQAEDCLHQLSACFKDVNDEHATQKPVECMMSINETCDYNRCDPVVVPN